MKNSSHRNALPMGHELHWYRIKGVLGQGGFGMTYIADDINLQRLVAIKEYMPAQISMREKDGTVQPTSGEVEEDYKWGLNRFISEARTLTQFEHPNLVRVFNVFEFNNTAYMVMNYERGESLQERVKAGYRFSEADLVKLLFSIMDGLEDVHSKGFVHRDIKPGNIYIRKDGEPVLLDFGSARQTRGEMETRTLTNFVSPGYAPIEQYTGKSDRQGPWTDIYGLGATVYQVITGNMPEASIDRSAVISENAGDSYISASMLCKGRYSEGFLSAIDHALAFNILDRPQSIADWRAEFGTDKENAARLETDEQERSTFQVTVETEKKYQTTEPQTRKTDPATVLQEIKPTAETEQIPTTVPDSHTQTQAHYRYHSIYIGLGVVAIGILAIIALRPYWPASESTIIPNVNDEITLEDVSAGSIEDEEKMVAEPAGPTVEERVAELLVLARQDIDALRLTTPAGNNAYDKYQEVLGLDFANMDAVRGIDAIVDKYLELVTMKIGSQELDQAEQYLQIADSLRPGQPKIVESQKALEQAIYERDRPKGFFGKINRKLKSIF